jgi:hypothetical protein
MAAAAEGGAFRELQLATVAGLEQFEIGFIMAIETEIVAVMTAMAHDDVSVLFGNEEVVLIVEAESGSFVALVTGVTIEVREIFLAGDQLGVGNADGVVAGEGRVDEGDVREMWRPPPGVQDEQSTQDHEHG